MLDPNTLVGLKTEEAFAILHEHKVSFGYTYQETRFNQKAKENHYQILIGNGVVLKAKLG